MAVDDARLRTYLNDHLAGATTAIWTADRLAAERRETELGGFLRRFAAELREDRAIVRSALGRLPGGESLVKRAVGAAGAILEWGRNVVPILGRPSLVEELEALAIGVWGRRLLWGTMTRVAAWDERFSDLRLDGLAERAEDQERELLRYRDDAISSTFRVAA